MSSQEVMAQQTLFQRAKDYVPVPRLTVPIIYTLGSCLFVSGAASAVLELPVSLASHQFFLVNGSYALGAVLFTIGIYIELTQILNEDELGNFKLWGWQIDKLSFRGIFIFLIGSLNFNLATVTAFVPHGRLVDNLLYALPCLIGCVCFTVSSFLLILEQHGSYWVWPPSNLGWWVSKSCLIGSITFVLGAFFGFDVPDFSASWNLKILHWCYLIGSFLFLFNGCSMTVWTFIQYRLVRQYGRLVRTIAKKYHKRGIPLVTLIAAGTVGLEAAASKYNARVDPAFESYAREFIYQSIADVFVEPQEKVS